MNDSLYLGFDGGATKTAGVALNREKEILTESVGESANFQIIGVERASEHILQVTEKMLEKLGADFSRIQSMFLGLAGAGRPDDANRMRAAFIELLSKKSLPIPGVGVGSDAIAALEGAFRGKPGMILISGTGSILFAKDKANSIHRIGGWGRFIGDEGSGYAIGRACLVAVARAFDGRGKETMMTRLLREKKNIMDAQSMVVEVYQKNFDIASAAPVTLEAAENGDETAIDIIAESARQLSDHVRAVINKLKEPLPLVLIGSILTKSNPLSRKFLQIIAEDFPEIGVQPAESSPAVGAALLAFKIEEAK
ncbi:MAG: hypothetical protein M1469_06520 [Bacteroidetes bacterium]|nr:hypothetical protein [Bacteroidota bacterium]